MTKKLIMVMAMMLLTLCLLSGGCSQVDDSKINAWKDMLKIPTSSDKNATKSNDAVTVPTADSQVTTEKISVKLYFVDPAQHKLVVEQRSIDKVEGIARETMQELLKGPSSAGYQAAVPAGTTLLDINVKPEGLCIVDLSSEAGKINSQDQGKLMIQSVANTLCQFPSIKEVSFLINSEKVKTLGGVVDIAQPVQANYSK